MAGHSGKCPVDHKLLAEQQQAQSTAREENGSKAQETMGQPESTGVIILLGSWHNYLHWVGFGYSAIDSLMCRRLGTITLKRIHIWPVSVVMFDVLSRAETISFSTRSVYYRNCYSFPLQMSPQIRFFPYICPMYCKRYTASLSKHMRAMNVW